MEHDTRPTPNTPNLDGPWRADRAADPTGLIPDGFREPWCMKTTESLSIAEQMKVLQSREDVGDVVVAHLGLPPEWRETNEEGNTERCQEAVNRVFTLTRKDIEDSLAAQGLQPRAAAGEHRGGRRARSYFISKRRGEWEFYFQERGISWPSHLYDLAEARKFLINYFIPVWLDHLHVPCRTKEGKMIKVVRARRSGRSCSRFGLESEIRQCVRQYHQLGLTLFLIGQSLTRILLVQQGGQSLFHACGQFEQRQIVR